MEDNKLIEIREKLLSRISGTVKGISGIENKVVADSKLRNTLRKWVTELVDAINGTDVLEDYEYHVTENDRAVMNVFYRCSQFVIRTHDNTTWVNYTVDTADVRDVIYVVKNWNDILKDIATHLENNDIEKKIEYLNAEIGNKLEKMSPKDSLASLLKIKDLLGIKSSTLRD